MSWLRDHVYLAAWASPILALLGIIIRGRTHGSVDIDWSRVMIYIGFLTCLAALFTPVLEFEARSAAAIVIAATLWFIIWDASEH